MASEEIVYNCVLNWINFDKKNREDYLPKLMTHVRFPLLSPQFLTDVCDKEAMLKKSFECRDMLDEAKRFYLRPDCRAEMSGVQYRMRVGNCQNTLCLFQLKSNIDTLICLNYLGSDENLVMLGGFGSQQKPLDIVEAFCPRTNTWSTLPVI